MYFKFQTFNNKRISINNCPNWLPLWAHISGLSTSGCIMGMPMPNHSYTDGHRGQLIADVISNSDHITLNTNTPARVSNTTLQQTSSSDITPVSKTLYNLKSWTTQHALSSDHLPIIIIKIILI